MSMRYSCQAMLLVGNYGAGTLNIIDGGEAASGTSLSLGYRSGSSGTVNIVNGGILTVPYIHLNHNEGSATVALNGGTIRAAKDGQTLIQAKANLYVTVGANGGTIDTAGYAVTIAEDIADATGETGTMTFKGGGKATLNVAPAYSGVTTVEVGTALVVPSAIAGGRLSVAIPSDGAIDGVYPMVSISGADTFAADVCDDIAKPDDAKLTLVLSLDRKTIYCLYGVDAADPVYIGSANGNLSEASNWLNGSVPTSGNAILSCTSAATLTVGDVFHSDTVTVPDGSAVVTISSGTLNVNTLTNAQKLAVASGATLNVAGDLVGTADTDGAWVKLLHSNEGTVTANRVVGYATVANTHVSEFVSVSANTRPIRAGQIVYKNMASPAQLKMYLNSNNDNDDGMWVVGENGFRFENSRQANYTTFFVKGNSSHSVVVTLGSSANWTLPNSRRPNSDNGDICVDSYGALVLDTADYDDQTVGHTITLDGRLKVSGGDATIKGCGTVVVNTTEQNNGLKETTVTKLVLNITPTGLILTFW